MSQITYNNDISGLPNIMELYFISLTKNGLN